MQLTLDKLDEIHSILTEYLDKSIALIKSIDLHADSTPSSESRQLADTILDQTSGYLVEVSHISSFLQKCDMHEIQIMPYQKNLFLECQQLCKKIKKSFDKIIKWVMQTKKHLNEIKFPIANEAHLDNCFKQSLDKNVVSEDLFKAYQQVRGVLKDIHKEAMLLDPKNMINHAGKRLEVMQGKSLFIETEHEMNILCDYGLFQYRENEKNIVERYYDLHHELYSDQKLAILQAYKEAQFSFLEIVKPIDDNGLIVYDHLKSESFLMIDKGAYQIARKHSGYALLTHYIQMPNFILTTGAATPVLLDSIVGNKMWKIFKSLINHHQNEHKLENSSYLQHITDLFKMVIHEDVAKKVTSRDLPMPT